MHWTQTFAYNNSNNNKSPDIEVTVVECNEETPKYAHRQEPDVRNRTLVDQTVITGASGAYQTHLGNIPGIIFILQT
jgi:hypothetical protein